MEEIRLKSTSSYRGGCGEAPWVGGTIPELARS